jgi:mRNA-degrading endonuclease toxin of MazEF toxin-antitoxin module
MWVNKDHPSTIIGPITAHVKPDSEILRVHLPRRLANLKEDGDIMIDQIRSIDNKRFLKKKENLIKAKLAGSNQIFLLFSIYNSVIKSF